MGVPRIGVGGWIGRGPLAAVVALMMLSAVMTTVPVTDAAGHESCVSGFLDVPHDAFYEDAVAWMGTTGITTGTSPTTFSPNDVVTRGQFAAFLFRFAGEPDAPVSGFVDVPAGAFYAAAVGWMASSGITTGTSATTFSPNDVVTRGQFAAFLFRFAGEPDAPVSGFVDVPAGAFYAAAVGWMASSGITTGTSATTFSPNSLVTRGQLATFLHRFAGEPEPCGGDVAASTTTTTTAPVSSTTTTTPAGDAPTTTTTAPPTSTTVAPTTTTTAPPVTTTTVAAGPPDPGTMAELIWTVEQEILPTMGVDYPWIGTAWDYINDNGTVAVDDLPGSVAGQVLTSCSLSGFSLPSCRATRLTMDPNHTDSIDVIIHELAHVFERTHGLAPDRSDQAAGQLYFEVTYGSAGCDAPELHADAMTRAADTSSYPYYWRNTCPSAPSNPDSEALAVVDDWVAGELTDWYVGRFDDGEALWAAVMAAPTFERYILVTNLQDEFGGYCSINNTVVAAFAGGADTNPFADGGC